MAAPQQKIFDQRVVSAQRFEDRRRLLKLGIFAKPFELTEKRLHHDNAANSAGASRAVRMFGNGSCIALLNGRRNVFELLVRLIEVKVRNLHQAGHRSA